MSDIVERLRAWNKDSYPHCWEAADEIERLTADLNILKRHYNLAPNAPLSREEIIAAKDAEIERLRQRIAELEDPHYLNGLYAKIRALGPQP